jgi:hypothetical protein
MAEARQLYFAERRFLLGAGLLLASLPALPAGATHSWGSAHWSRTSTLAIRLGDNVGTAWDTHLANAAADWSKPSYLETIVARSGKDPVKCAPTYGRVEVCNARYGSTGWLGLADVWTSNGHVVQGTARLNDTYFAQRAFNTGAMRRSVMCQEIGHTLGLDHQDVNMDNFNLGTCLDYTSDPSGTKGTNGTLKNTRPNAHDYGQLASIYKHLDGGQLSSTKLSSSTSAAEAPSRGELARLAAPGGLSQREWGRAVRTDGRGRPRVFVRRLDANTEVTTFVIWADAHQEH